MPTVLFDAAGDDSSHCLAPAWLRTQKQRAASNTASTDMMTFCKVTLNLAADAIMMYGQPIVMMMRLRGQIAASDQGSRGKAAHQGPVDLR